MHEKTSDKKFPLTNEHGRCIDIDSEFKYLLEKEIIEWLKQNEGLKRRLHRILKFLQSL